MRACPSCLARSSGDKGGIEAGLGREPGPGGDLTPSTLPAVLQLIPEQAVSQSGGESVDMGLITLINFFNEYFRS